MLIKNLEYEIELYTFYSIYSTWIILTLSLKSLLSIIQELYKINLA